VAIVNRKFAEKYFNGESPIGKIVRQPAFRDDAAQDYEIVGEVADAVYTNLRDPLTPTIYLPMAQMAQPPSSVFLTLRTQTATPASLTRSVTAALASVNSDLSVTFRPMDDIVDATLSQERLIAMLSGFFGMLALLLAALGLYGVTAYSVIRRRAELGIRMALGASPRAVVRMVLARVGTLVIAGIVLGGAASWYASRFVATLLFGLPPTDKATIASAMLLLATVAAVSGWFPARRAARIDPMEVLREG
jgi:ABC-type antimicrobial peptide transport system permease subunit